MIREQVIEAKDGPLGPWVVEIKMDILAEFDTNNTDDIGPWRFKGSYDGDLRWKELRDKRIRLTVEVIE